VEATPEPNPLHAWNGGSRTDVPLFLHSSGGTGPRPDDGTPVLLLRLFSVAFGVLTLAAVLALSRSYLAGPWQLIPAIFVATLPQFLFASATISNDGLAILLVTLCLLFALRLLDAPARPRYYLLLGGALGLALLTKKTSLFLVPGLALLAGFLALRCPARRGRIALLTLALLATATLVSGWYFARSHALYGDPLGWAMEKATLAPLVQEKSLRSPYFVDWFPREFRESFVGRFGWMQLSLPAPVYTFYGLLLLVGAAGTVLAVLGRRFPAPQAFFATLFVLSCFGGIVAYNLTYSQPQGRFLFPVLPLVALLLGVGLRELLGRLPLPGPARAIPLAAVLGALVLVDGLSLVALLRFYGGV
jgi:4-amino-4-deoxy-L-arabinose transferase-like glycosyltransferase